MLALDWNPPDQFEEYRLIRLLGRGGVGEVYLARDSLLDRPVAVKFVPTATDPAVRARFFQEARAIARLQHPNVVAIHRIAEVGGHPYLVSEYVRGQPLDQLDRPVPSRRVLEIALDLARGLAAAHRCGVLHRDVKPANAILSEDGRVKLLDFGLASIADGPRVDDDAAEAPRPAERAAPITSDRGRAVLVPLVGTALYIAPELWRGEPASQRSDLYSLGILLYELLTGDPPFANVPQALFRKAIERRTIPPVAGVAAGVDPALAAIVDRLVARDPAARFASADALVVALEECAAPTPAASVPDGNPYRGLAAFESAHAPLFFGRRGEIRELVHRVRSEAFVVVGGDSGTGKSSLCRAGILPWLVGNDGWTCIDVVPGRHPVRSLAAALAGWLDADEATLDSLLRDTPEAFARAIRQRASQTGDHPGRRLLLFVDQLEELLTLSDPDEARVVAAALAALSVRVPFVRILAAARSDFLWRLAMLPGLSDEMTRGLYFLRPLAGERIREAVVRPAAAKGVNFESEALVDALVAQTEQAPGGLPLLQFTLAEVWDTRDVTAGVIRADSLAAVGGVAGALTRHADRLIAGLDAHGRDAARRVLLRLVTAEGTRARRTEDELWSAGPEREFDRATLELLVRGRIVVANDTQHGGYEIAHEALLSSWPTLLGWLSRDAADHAMRLRIEQAAAEWERMGCPRDLLWSRQRLAAAEALDRRTMPPRDAAFLAASRAAITRKRTLAAVAVALVALALGTTGAAFRARARRQLESVIANQESAATAAFTAARTMAKERDAARVRVYGLFDTGHWTEAEDGWNELEALEARESDEYRAASGHLESALSLAPARDSLRAQLSDLTFERLVRTERDHRSDLAAEFAARLAASDDGRHSAALGAEASVMLDVEPRGTLVWSERPGAPRELLGLAPLSPRSLPPGSLTLVFEAPGRDATRLPVLLARGETFHQRVRLPRAGAVPAGMIYVPAGRFLFGSSDSTDLRRGFLKTAPIHEVRTAGYYIGRHEVTFGEWIAFLDEQPPEERHRRTPGVASPQSSLALTELGPKRWRIALTPTARTYTAETGQHLRYEHRAIRADQDWTRLPVSAISYDDAVAFAAWLDRSGRIPGARLCDEYEWERAARGADGRTFPSGSELGRDDADIDVTYGRDSLAFGPDEVGSHPASRSPVGADDMAGNVWEWTRSVQMPGVPVARGGGWYNGALSARSMNRESSEPTQRHVHIGVRLCATPRASDDAVQTNSE